MRSAIIRKASQDEQQNQTKQQTLITSKIYVGVFFLKKNINKEIPNEESPIEQILTTLFYLPLNVLHNFLRGVDKFFNVHLHILYLYFTGHKSISQVIWQYAGFVGSL